MQRRFVLLGLTILSFSCVVLSGCSQTGATAKMSEKEKADFKGGPMPPEARAEMAKRMAAINNPPPAQTKK